MQCFGSGGEFRRGGLKPMFAFSVKQLSKKEVSCDLAVKVAGRDSASIESLTDCFPHHLRTSIMFLFGKFL